jgi:hypothetical protein
MNGLPGFFGRWILIGFLRTVESGTIKPMVVGDGFHWNWKKRS